ncbi:HAD family hydrolase [Olsenella sp. Marseille-P4559]|uniref:HAD family hydrolase n=1 Tax=Olsenella sp. Marseille-P4559 TaxID=2364795 RepID=UPI0010303B98|nr:HAD family hydrolase [Olsenella sp. Marseille-P4559]
MHTPKLIASDIDGTMLINWAPRFSPQMLGLVERIVDAGIAFVPASGRQYTNLQRLFSPVADRISYVCENGALAIMGGELVYRATMDDGLAHEIIEDMLSDPGCEPVVSGMRTVYVRSGAPELVDHLTNVTGYNVTELGDVTQVPEPFMKVSAYCTDGVPREKHWHERFGGRCSVKVSGLQWLDLVPNGVDKGMALSALADRLGIDAADCMVFGDAENDMEMLRWAGCPIVVESSQPSVLPLGRYRTDTVEHAFERILSGRGFVW